MDMHPPELGRENETNPLGSLIARSDTKGFITYVNDALVDASGFSRSELIGRHFNDLYHPDMPPTLLDAMKRKLKQGALWTGVVKNLCKDGGHFWVSACVAPVRRNGETVGYLSVGEKLARLAREDIARAEKDIKSARISGGPFGHGGKWDWKRFLSVKNGVAIGIVFVTLMMIAGGLLGVGGLRLSSQAMRTLYYEEMEPVRTIGRINFLMADNRAQIALAMHHNPAVHDPAEFDHTLATHLELMEKNRKEIDELWETYRKLPHTGEERRLTDEYWHARSRYVTEGLMAAKAALERGDFQAAEQRLLKNVNPLYREANVKVEELLKHLSAKAESNFIGVAERNESISILAVTGVAFGILVVIVSGFFFFRGTVMPLETAIAALERITEGQLSGKTESSGHGEPGRVMAAVATMQVNLKVMMDEIRQSSGAIHEQCRRLNLTMMNLAQHSEEQHDRVYQALDSISRSCGDLDRLARTAEAMVHVTENSEGLIAEILEKCLPVPEETEQPLQEKIGVPIEHIDPQSVILGNRQLTEMSQELAGMARIEAFSAEETASQMNQVAALIVENRGEVQGAWAASQQLEHAAQELDKLVKNFE